MNRLRILLIGTTTTEAMRLEAIFEQAGCLGVSRCVTWRQVVENPPDWPDWNLICARYWIDPDLPVVPLLSGVLRGGVPPVFFLVDDFEPTLVQTLWNIGAARVVPVGTLEDHLAPCLVSVFGQSADLPENPALHTASKNQPPFLQDQDRVLFYHNPVGMCVLKPASLVCLDCNSRFAELLGWGRFDLLGREIFELKLRDELDTLLRETCSQDAQGMVCQVERSIINGKHETLRLLIQLVCIMWQGEKNILCVAQDITEQEKSRERARRLNDELEKMVEIRTRALRSANEELAAEVHRRTEVEEISSRLEEIIWEVPDIIAICGLDGRLHYLNKAGRKTFLLGEEDPIDQVDVFKVYPPMLRNTLEQVVVPQLILDGVWKGEMRLLRPDGQPMPVSQLMLYHRGDTERSSYLAAILHDIGDFKRIEQDLRQSRERYRILAEAAHDLIFMVNVNGSMEYANRFACDAMGIDPARAEGLRANVFFPEELSSELLQMIQEVREINSPVYTEGPFYINHEKHWLGTWLVPVYSGDDRLSSILGISRDITDQKRADEALKQALIDQKQLNEIRTKFFSMTSHQFRTPLSTIILSTDLLMKFNERWDGEKRSEHLGRIQKAARQINKMLEDILMIGRVESGRYVPSSKSFDLAALCQQAIQEMALNDQNEHSISLVVGTRPLPVHTDARLIEGIVDNLLSNALKYSPVGTEVTLKIGQEDQQVFLEVIDEGIGIPEKEMKNLFQPFHRASNVTDLPGTGIGLTIVQKSAELIRGDVFVKSKEGQGTTFVVRFPAHFESPETAE